MGVGVLGPIRETALGEYVKTRVPRPYPSHAARPLRCAQGNKTLRRRDSDMEANSGSMGRGSAVLENQGHVKARVATFELVSRGAAFAPTPRSKTPSNVSLGLPPRDSRRRRRFFVACLSGCFEICTGTTSSQEFHPALRLCLGIYSPPHMNI